MPSAKKTSKPGLRAAVWGAILLPLLSAVLTASPNLIRYQGRLRESGQPVTGTKSIELRIFDASAGGTQRWSITQTDPGELALGHDGTLYYAAGSELRALR